MVKLTKWLKIVSIGFLHICFSASVKAQDSITHLSLEQCYQLARNNYPLIQQKALIQKSAFINIENLQTALLPQISLNGQASYQSDVTAIKIPIPNFSMSALSKDQYKLWAEMNQLIYDGGMIQNEKLVQTFSQKVDQQKLEVEMYQLRNRINQIYLGTFLLDAQLVQADLAKDNIEIGLKTVRAQLANGLVFKSALLVLEAQALQEEQHIAELRSNKKSLLKVLSIFLQKQINENVILEEPPLLIKSDTSIQRPEIQWYQSQHEFLNAQQNLIRSKLNPKLSLFAQGAYGRPGLNMLNNDFSWYGIGGLRLNWSISNYYTQKKEHTILHINQEINEVQKNVFEFNTKTQSVQQLEEISKLAELVKLDKKIIEVRKQITEAAKAQLENGVISSNDYLREINAEDQIKNNAIVHKIQLLLANINYQNILGN